MSTITLHRPAYVTGYTKEVGTFTTAKELVTIWFVAGFSRIDGFHRYSLWREDDIVHLMAEYEAGSKWWVVGQIEGEPPDLPNWKPK